MTAPTVHLLVAPPGSIARTACGARVRSIRETTRAAAECNCRTCANTAPDLDPAVRADIKSRARPVPRSRAGWGRR